MPDPILQIQERNELISVLAGTYEFRSTDNRIAFVDASGLGRFIPGTAWEGPARNVAQGLVVKLERYGQLRERPTYHALGALLEATLALGELEPAKARLIAVLICRYSLVADPEYLDRLRAEHKIDEPAVREVPAEHAAPATGAPRADEGPDFEPEIPAGLAYADKTGEEALETVLNTVDNFLDLQLLTGAVYCGQAVCRIEAPLGSARGTGFLLGPALLLTNQHVLKRKEDLAEAVARFDYVKDWADGANTKGRVIKLAPDFYHSSPATELDYALVKLEEAPLAAVAAAGDELDLNILDLAAKGRHRGYLLTAPSILTELRRVNVLQHPAGEAMKVVLTQNYVVRSTGTRLHYVADTMKGSSGSPVFNERWQVVALHHSGRPYPKPVGPAEKDWKTKYRVNEGVQMRAILEDFQARGLDRYLPRPRA